MHREGPEVHIDEQEARAGRKGTFLLKILLLSMVLVVAAMGAIWLVGAATAPELPDPEPTEIAQ